MVVDYVEGNRLNDGGAYCAAALVGSALRHTPSTEATDSQIAVLGDIEEYFRAAEPVTHDDWLPTTRRLRESYDWRGSAGRLRGLRSELRQLVIQRLLIAEEPSPDEGPELLSRMLNLGQGCSSGGDGRRTERARLEIVLDREGCCFDPARSGWTLQGELTRHGKGDATATAGLSFSSLADSGKGEAWRISDLELLGSDRDMTLDDSDSRRFVFSVGSSFSTLPFRCLVKPPAGMDPTLAGFRQGG